MTDFKDETMAATAYSYLRFSTPEQALGDSERRQIEAAAAWAKSKKLKLDSSHTDRGLSGYKGVNRKKGKLGEFLAKVKSGEIPSGSFLVVEDLDRLSREHPLDSLRLVQELIGHGIIITVLNGEEYSNQTLRSDPSGTKMLGLVFQLGRSSGESRRKSELITKTWEQKRRLALNENRVMTSRTPAWIRTVRKGEKKHFELIKSRVHVLKQIFEWYLNGLGQRAIAKRLNDLKIPNWGDSSGSRIGKKWYYSYIRKLLTNESVTGVFQPHSYVWIDDPANKNERKQVRKQIGAPLKGYYPCAVKKDVFAKVQVALSDKTKKLAGGRINTIVSNLFPGLIWGKLSELSNRHKTDEPENNDSVLIPAKYVWKGTVHGHGRYLVSDTEELNKKRKKRDEIPSVRWPYPAVEMAVLLTLKELNWNEISKVTRADHPKTSELAVLKHERLEINKKCKNIGESIALKPLPTLISMLADLELRRSELTLRITDLQREIDSSHVLTENLSKPLLISKKAFDPTEKDIRLSLRSEIAKRIKRIILTPKQRIEKKEGYRISNPFQFSASIELINGSFRYIRVTINRNRPPEIKSITFKFSSSTHSDPFAD